MGKEIKFIMDATQYMRFKKFSFISEKDSERAKMMIVQFMNEFEESFYSNVTSKVLKRK